MTCGVHDVGMSPADTLCTCKPSEAAAQRLLTGACGHSDHKERHECGACIAAEIDQHTAALRERAERAEGKASDMFETANRYMVENNDLRKKAAELTQWLEWEKSQRAGESAESLAIIKSLRARIAKADELAEAAEPYANPRGRNDLALALEAYLRLREPAKGEGA